MAQDVISKMAEEQWILNEDGYLNVDTNVKEIVYHPYLNVILICTHSGEVKVLDVNTGLILQSSYLSALNLTEVKCKYIPTLDRVLFTDGQALGVRSDYNGVLLLDSILQKTTRDSKEEVKLELPLSEAIILKESFSNNLSSVDHIINELTDVILKAQKYLRRGIKAQKWNTVCLNIPLEDLRIAAADIVSILLTKKQHVPELGVASAVQERLADLLGEKVNASDRKSMASEWRRRETYSEWPHMDYKWALPGQMAQAGFYHQPNSSGDDRAMCFTCTVCLVCWERTDEPCSEHERHSPSCPFVVGEYTQNVPLSVTYATSPAIDCTYRGLNVKILGNSNVPNMVPTANNEGLISVFDVSGKVKRLSSFYFTQLDSCILDKFTKDFGQVGVLAIAEHKKYPVEKKVTSLCIVSSNDFKSTRSSLVCGLSLSTRLDKFPKITQMDNEDAPLTRLYLVVYDFLLSVDPHRELETESPVLLFCPEEEDHDDEKVSNLLNLNSSNVNSEELPGYNLMKQLSSFYESFVPCESDEVFLPPPKLNVPKPHTGPRVLLFDEYNTTKTDSSSSSHPITNGQLTSLDSKLSISDHINELKNNPSPKKLSYSRAVQCIGLPEQCKNFQGLEISDIIPTLDRKHILVVLKSNEIAESFLVLYSLDFSNQMVKVIEQPVLICELAGHEKPIEINLLPPIDRFGIVSERKCEAEGNTVMVCADGLVRIVNLATLRVICFAKIEDDAFVSVAYCNSLDRLCASTKKGSLHFYALTNADNESSDDHEDEDMFGINVDNSNSMSQQLDTLDNSELAKYFQKPPDTVSLPDLRNFYSLCEFESLKTGFCVVVSSSWSEFQQSLRQRRLPTTQKEEPEKDFFSTHGRKYCEGEGESTMKTWRLISDVTTYDEHIFEITLPNPTILGHLDVHFTLQPSTFGPQVEVTLLKQNKSGIGHKKDVKFSVDETVTIEKLEWVDNPVVTQEYLRAHNAEILVGPIAISSYLDMTDENGTVTMTSPKLHKTKVRNLLLHVKAVHSKEDVSKSRAKFDKPSNATADKSGKIPVREIICPVGCDVIHELSISMYTFKQSPVPNDRTQRSLMLESNVFAQSMLLTVLSETSMEVVRYSLDILDWIAATRLTRNRSNNGQPPNQQFEFLEVVEESLPNLIEKCLLHGGRSIAHKCVKFILTCCRGAENINPDCKEKFFSLVLASLFSILDSINEINSSAGLQWLLALLLKVSSKAKEAAVAEKCISLLGKVSGELLKLSNPYHLLLRGRYGLYGTPMEPELFDIEPPNCTKRDTSPSGSKTLSGNSENGANTTQYSFNKENINPKDVLSTNPVKLKHKNIASQRNIRGLIETQPLHFTCLSASEGTRIERLDAASASPMGYLNALLPVPMSSAPSSDILGNSNKKVYMEKLMDSVGKMMKKAQPKNKSFFVGTGSKDSDDGEGGGSIQWMPLLNITEIKSKDTEVDSEFEMIKNAKPMNKSIFDDYTSTSNDNDGEGANHWKPLNMAEIKLKDTEVDSKIDAIFVNLVKKIEDANSNAAKQSNNQPDEVFSSSNTTSLLPWHQLLEEPPNQVVVVERMHSGARRHVTLDFGKPILLTDIFIPSCSDLVTVTVHIWLKGEDVDDTRLVVMTDIGWKSLLLNDLQPPPLCQFMKITMVGRYGMSTMRSRIPLGCFYGHIVVLPEDTRTEFVHNSLDIANDPEKQFVILTKLFEDISCRYSLACSQLKELLRPFQAADLKNAMHMAAYMNLIRDKSMVVDNAEHSKVLAAYQETIKFQHQLNIIKNAIVRIECSIHESAPPIKTEASTDKLTAIAEGLLEVLLSMDHITEMPRDLCQQFFQGLCLTQPPRLQLLAAIFLEKQCGRAAYFGDFLADTLAEAFSTSCTFKFPQDRLFILLAYLCRKSPEKSATIDAAMRIVHDTLRPLREDRKSLLATTVDLPLLSWQLMYLSLQLSLCKMQGGAPCRWNWVLGEMVSGKNGDSSKNANKKKTCKRMAQPGNSSSTMQSYPSYSSVVMNSDTQSYQQKLKNLVAQDKLFRIKHLKKALDDNRTKEKKEQFDKPNAALRMPQFVNSSHCLVVARGLLRLILSMDHSSSADMLLLCFKVVSKLVTLGKLQLSQLLEESELLELITFCISCKIPWAPFALTCFLQDTMELNQPKSDDVEMETETTPSASWSPNETTNEVESISDSYQIEMVEPIIKPSKTSGSIISNNSFPPLPSVYESEDSEFEELLEDLQKVRCTNHGKNLKPVSTTSNTDLSKATDLRLELGVQAHSEVDLKKLIVKNAEVLLKMAIAEVSTKESNNGLNQWSTATENCPPESPLNNHTMLKRCFVSLFENLQNQDVYKIEHILQLWLTLNGYSKFVPSTIPQITLDCQSVQNLISTMAWTPGLSLTVWCSALRTLTLVCNMNNGKVWMDLSGMADVIVNHVDFVQLFLSLLSGTGPAVNGKILAGPSLCRALHDFLVRLQMRCDIVSAVSILGNLLKTSLLKVVYQLAQPSGSIASRLGPLDAQCKLLQNMLYMNFVNTDLSIAMSTLESTATLVFSCVLNKGKVRCGSIVEKQANTFSDIFASVLGPDTNKDDRPVTYEDLLILLLKLMGKLVQTPLPDQTDAMDTESATDESKVERILHAFLPNTLPCFADIVLQHHPTVIRLCRCLAACKSSSLCMLANVTEKIAIPNMSDPNTVGDAIFHLLSSLAKKASSKELLLQPLLAFLTQTSQLSEPLLWFILQVLDNEDAIKKFLNLDGVSMLGRSIVNSANSPSTLSKTGTISTVMQHFSGITTPPSDPASFVVSTANSSSTPSSVKKLLNASMENKVCLVNFAPYCTISCLSTTAQPADGLIQFASGVTHRRARTPLWSYHFYPDENYTELMLQLPSAVLLKEVQLHPHPAGLSTCPSSVALEVSAYGPLRLTPACLPLPTSGLTLIRLHLPVPRVANCVLIRLYRPRDANSIGLLQIRLLGSFAFGGSWNQNVESEDEVHCNHSLGWLRLLHHCFTLATETELKRQIVDRASRVQNLLTTCCGLLLVPSHILPVYMPCLEKVLRELALFSPENGYQIMKVLLDSRTGVIEPLMVLDSNWQDKLINVSGYQSACELLYQICEHQDVHTPYRLKILLDWTEATANQAIVTNNPDSCNPAYISNVASILWSAKHSQVQYDLESLVTLELFNTMRDLRTRVKCSTCLKYSIDSLMCSACYIRPEFYSLLLQEVGVLGRGSISDDIKDSESMTDDSKRHSERYNHLVIGELSQLDLTREQLDTIALVSRCPTAVQQLLNSGLPKMLNNAIFEFCSSVSEPSTPMAKADVTSILQFFTDISDEKTMRDWLGSEDGSSFWFPLLQWLCRKPSIRSSNLQTEAHVHLEEVCVKFLMKCCLCHAQNQARLAKVLCDVICTQSNGISGFMRRLILQLLLENEKIPVSIEADETLYKSTKLVQNYVPAHPAFKQTYNRTMLCLGTNTTLLDILEQHVLFNTTCKTENEFNKKSNGSTKKNIFKSWLAGDEQEMSMAAGVTAKDKRAKDAKNMLSAATPQSKKKRYTSDSSGTNDTIEGRIIKCEAYSDQPLPLMANLGQLLRLIEAKGTTIDWPYVHLKIYQCKSNEDKPSSDMSSSTFQQQPPICSALQVFSSIGGLALLAQHLPTVYPDAIRPPHLEKPATESFDSDWIKLEECDDIYEDMMEDAMRTSSPSKSSVLISHIPPHSMTAFGLFLRLPGYAEVLLKDMKRALYLLRLILGVTDDGEGGNIFNSPVSDSLPTLPFEVLKKLYDATPLTTDDGRLLRRISINLGVVQLLLTCLGIFTHHSSNNGDKDQNNKNKEERSQLYWAKGTGFGTGSTQQSWNVEQALMKQRNEEEHVTVLLQVLASYINPNDEAEEDLGENVLPQPFNELITQSALLPAICSYLRNDSVLDMARHIPLYKAVLLLLRSLAVSSQLVSLLLPQKKKNSDPSVCSLLMNMKACVDTYTSKLRFNSKAKSKTKLSEQIEDLEQGEGLATLMPDIQNTANLVSRVTSGLVDSESSCDSDTSVDKKTVISLDEQYLRIMKNLQFASFEMISELPDGGIRFVVSHHFESNAKTTSEQSHPARVKRIAQEAVTLSTSLPLSYSSSVFVRYDTSRLDVMKVLITGPSDTPYANGCFELDVFFPPDYPSSPMMINLETTGHHTVRFNPNLYNDGKVCLSVLNTWHGRPEEKWNAQTSSFLQVLVSIQSLILVSEPYFNEPGYERARGTPAGTVSSRDYNLNICQSTVRWAMLEQIVNPCPCFKDVVHAHFYIKRHEVLAQVEQWIWEVEQEVAKEKKMTRSSKKSPASTLESFKKVYEQLKVALAKLKPPPEMMEEEEEEKKPTNMEVAIEVHNVDTDKDMEKMVNDMCE